MSRVRAMLATAVLATALLATEDALAAFPVGHTVKRVTVPGTLPQEVREVDVHLWYPADAAAFAQAAPTVYRSALYGDTRIPAGWKPLSWSVDAEIAREARDRPAGQAVPGDRVLDRQPERPDRLRAHARADRRRRVRRRRAVSREQHRRRRADRLHQPAGRDAADPLQRRPAAAGDVRSRRLLEDQRAEQHRRPRPGRLVRAQRAARRGFGNRVDVAQAGVFGHSRGTLTALTAAGGSTVLGRRARAARAGDHGRVDRRAGARQPDLARERQGAGAARRRPARRDLPAGRQQVRLRQHLERRQALRRDPERAPPHVRLDLLRPGAVGGRDRHGRPDADGSTSTRST